MCDLCVLSLVLKIGVVIVPRIRILDASTEEYQEEEEEVYFQGEEDHFDQYTNQGKLIFLQAFTNASYTLASYPNARLYESKALLHFYLMSTDPTQVLFLPAFTCLSKLPFIVNFRLIIEYYKSIKLSLESYKLISTPHD